MVQITENVELLKLKAELGALNSAYQTDKGSLPVQLKLMQDPKKTDAERAAAKKKYDAIKARIVKNGQKIAETQKQLDVLVNKPKLEKIENKIAELQKAISLQLDPKSSSALKLKADLEKLVPEWNSVQALAGGTILSPTVAKAKVLGMAIPTIGGTTATAGTTATDTTLAKPTTVVVPKATGTQAATGTATASAGATDTPASTEISMAGIKPGVPSKNVAGDEKDKAAKAAEAVAAAQGVGIPTGQVKAPTPFETLIKQSEFWYDLPDYIFTLEPKLQDILVKAVNEGWTNEKFLATTQSTPWWQKNAPAIRTRIVNRAKYDELKAAGEDVSKTEYGLYLKKQMNSVKAKAQELAGVTLNDEQAQNIASKIYDGFLDEDPMAITKLITPYIGKINTIIGTGTVSGYAGQALKDYQSLQTIAKANGLSLKDILPNVSALTTGGNLEQSVLQKIAAGEIDINAIAQNARTLASAGQPQYVRDLLNQGYDLTDVYAPYRKTMATSLELDPNAIDLSDPTLRAAISDKGDMNLYDFSKVVRQDPRWQYTKGAKDEVSNAALKVLQDFGFQG